MVVSQVVPVLGNFLTLPEAIIITTLDAGMGDNHDPCARVDHLWSRQNNSSLNFLPPHLHLEKESFDHTMIGSDNTTIRRTTHREHWSLPC